MCVYSDVRRNWTHCQCWWWTSGLVYGCVSPRHGAMFHWTPPSRCIWKVAPSTWRPVTVTAPSTACWPGSPSTPASTGSTSSHGHTSTAPSSLVCSLVSASRIIRRVPQCQFHVGYRAEHVSAAWAADLPDCRSALKPIFVTPALRSAQRSHALQ